MLHNQLAKRLPDAVPRASFRDLIMVVVGQVELVLRSGVHFGLLLRTELGWRSTLDGAESRGTTHTIWFGDLDVQQVIVDEIELGEVTKRNLGIPDDTLEPEA